MEFMAGNDIRECADTDLRFVGNAPAQPGAFLQTAEQKESGAADAGKLFRKHLKPAMREWTIAHVIVLLKPLNRGGVAARDSKRAVGEDSLSVDDVTEHLSDAPFPGCVAIIASLLAYGR